MLLVFYLDLRIRTTSRTVYLPEEEYKELEAAGEDMKYYYTAHYALQDITYNLMRIDYGIGSMYKLGNTHSINSI